MVCHWYYTTIVPFTRRLFWELQAEEATKKKNCDKKSKRAQLLEQDTLDLSAHTVESLLFPQPESESEGEDSDLESGPSRIDKRFSSAAIWALGPVTEDQVFDIVKGRHGNHESSLTNLCV